MQRSIKDEAAVLAARLAGGVIRAGAPPPALAARSRASPGHPDALAPSFAVRAASPSSLVRLRQRELEGIVGTLAERSISPLQVAYPASPPAPPTAAEAPGSAAAAGDAASGPDPAAPPQPPLPPQQQQPAVSVWAAGEGSLPMASPARPQPPARKGSARPSLHASAAALLHRQPQPALVAAEASFAQQQQQSRVGRQPALPQLGAAQQPPLLQQQRPSRSDRRSPVRQAKPARAALSPLRDAALEPLQEEVQRQQQLQLQQHKQQQQRAHLEAERLRKAEFSVQALQHTRRRGEGGGADEGLLAHSPSGEESPLGSDDGDEGAPTDWKHRQAARQLYLRTLKQREASVSPTLEAPSGSAAAAAAGGGGGGSPPLGRRGAPLTPVQLALLRRTLHSKNSAERLLGRLAAIKAGGASPPSRHPQAPLSAAAAAAAEGAMPSAELLAAQRELLARARDAAGGRQSPPAAAAAPPPAPPSPPRAAPRQHYPPLAPTHPALALDDLARSAVEGRSRALAQQSLRYAPPSPLRTLGSEAPLLVLQAASSATRAAGGAAPLQAQVLAREQEQAQPQPQAQAQRRSALPALPGIEIEALLRAPPAPLPPLAPPQRQRGRGGGGPGAPGGSGRGGQEEEEGEGGGEEEGSGGGGGGGGAGQDLRAGAQGIPAPRDIKSLLVSPRRGGGGGGGLQGQLAKLMQLVGSAGGDDSSDEDEDSE